MSSTRMTSSEPAVALSPTKIILKRCVRRLEIPLFFLVLAFAIFVIYSTGNSKESRAAAGCLVVILFWVFLILPMPITSLMPIFLFPFLGISTTESMCENYMKKSNFLLLAGIGLALALEYSNLHRRFALWALIQIGTSEKWLLLGFMLPSAFLSFWINNTSTTAIMLPIADALFIELSASKKEALLEDLAKTDESESEAPSDVAPTSSLDEKEMLNGRLEAFREIRDESEQLDDESRYYRNCVLIAIAMSANIGGTGTVVGTTPNILLMEFIELTVKPGEESSLNYFTWALFAIPNLIIILLLSWLWFLGYFFGFKKLLKWRDEHPEQTKKLSEIVLDRYKDLGKKSSHEKIVLIGFTVIVLCWIFRAPGFMPGWGSLMFKEAKVLDATTGMLGIIALMVLPRRCDLFCMYISDKKYDFPASPAITWNIIHNKIAWSVFLIMGCGFALSSIIKSSGLSVIILKYMSGLDDLSVEVLVIISCGVMLVMTVFVSNAAATSILIPILAELSLKLRIHPLYLMLSATLCSSWAFMFPFSTPPNTLIYEWGKIKFTQLAGQGLGLTVICATVTVIMINTYGVLIFDLKQYPDWAK